MTGRNGSPLEFGDGKRGRLAHIIVVIFATVVSVIGFIAILGGHSVNLLLPFCPGSFCGYISASFGPLSNPIALIIIGNKRSTLHLLKGGMYRCG